MLSEFITSSTKLILNLFCCQLIRITSIILSLTEQLIKIISHLILIVVTLTIIYVSKWVCLLFGWLLLYHMARWLIDNIAVIIIINKLIVLNLLLRSTLSIAKIKHILALVIIHLLLTCIVVIEETQQVRII